MQAEIKNQNDNDQEKQDGKNKGKKKRTHLAKTKGIKKVVITTDKGIDITSVKIIHKSTIGILILLLKTAHEIRSTHVCILFCINTRIL